MTTHHDDDRELDAFLRGDDDLSSLLRQAPQPEVPPELDARILAQARAALARAALAEPAHAGREAANDPAPAPWLMRMRVPLGLAATVVIGVSMSLRWTGWQEGTPVVLVSDSDPAVAAAPPPPAVAAKPGVSVEAAAPRGQDASGVATSGVATSRPAAPPVHARPVPAPAPRATAQAEEEVLPPPPPPPPAPAPMAPSAPAPIALPAPAPAAPTVYYRSAPPAPAPAAPVPAAPVPAAPAPAPAAPALAPQASTRVEVTGSRITRSDEAATGQRAEQWLALLTELLDHHLDDDARDNWVRFRREFPDYPVPPDLQARIDALQRAP